MRVAPPLNRLREGFRCAQEGQAWLVLDSPPQRFGGLKHDNLQAFLGEGRGNQGAG